ncbi:MAG: hypothetical protein HFH68_14870 [Lachnospiraceae bacterium]|nr:hypothetical protein [Lachnospiraceae bacterium]
MRQYEFAIRIAQIHHLVEEHKYKKALAVIRTLDMKQVKSISDLTIIADVFARTEQFDSAKEAYLKIYNKSKTRRVVYRLISISIRTKELGDAEKYYNEFVQMGPSTRDIIILRYRIDKAAGVHIGKLVEILEELKEEEYIEEWAYELARLYYKAGRFEECRRECEDILLWFGHGEIVERAKKLIEYVDDKEAMPYIDDKDYTIERNEPNPDDTGSLPDLHEYLSSMQQEEENRKKYLKDRKTREQAEHKKERTEDRQKEKGTETAVTKEPGNMDAADEESMQNQDGFIDDYEEDDFGIDAGLGKLAQKLTDFLHFGSKKDKKGEEEGAGQDSYGKKDLFTENSQIPASEDGYIIEDSGKENLDIKIRINQDLYNKTLAEARNQEKKEEKTFDKEEPVNENNLEDITPEMENVKEQIPVVKETSTNVKQLEPVYFQAGLGITQDLSREISAIYEAEHKGQLKEAGYKEQLKEKEVKVVSSRRPLKRDATKVIERMTKAVKSDENKNLPSAGYEETEEKNIVPEIKEDDTGVMDGIQEPINEAVNQAGKEPVLPEENIAGKEQEDTEQEAGTLSNGISEIEDNSILVSKEEIELAEIEAKRAHEEALLKAEEARAIVEEARKKAEEAERMLAEIEKKHAANIVQNEENGSQEENSTEMEAQEEAIKETAIETTVPGTTSGEDIEGLADSHEETEMQESVNMEYGEETEYLQEPLEEAEIPAQEDTSRNIEEEKLSDDDLPTTRALHTSFGDILTLIGGEPDPSHFVFVGNTFDLITGLSKRIVKVMKATGYMSTGRIARISAKTLNKMDLAEFKSQLKGNCLLIDDAADLMIPTIASIFEIMDEYYGDFVVILADNGNTLDQLFKFAPALARRFKYIIDISGYTEEDCE